MQSQLKDKPLSCSCVICLCVVHIAVSGMTAFLCKSEKSKVKQRKLCSVHLQFLALTFTFYLFCGAASFSVPHLCFSSALLHLSFHKEVSWVEDNCLYYHAISPWTIYFHNNDSAHVLHVQYKGRRKICHVGRYRLRGDVPLNHSLLYLTGEAVITQCNQHTTFFFC